MPPGETPSVLKVLGSEQEAILASPPQVLEAGGPVYRLARLFDISRRSEAFRMEGLIRFSGQWADQRETLSLPAEAGEVFVAPGEAQHLRPEERVVVLRTGDQTRVYAVPALRRYAGVEDAPGGVPVLVSWHFFPQAASCLVARAGDGRIHWRDAGLFYRGAEVVHDRESGSLWDTLGGQALTGPRAGESVPTLPVEVWPWEAWRAQNPQTKVLAATPDGRIPSASPAPYLASVYLPPGLLAYKDEDGPLPAKQFVLGLVFDGGARAYPLTPRAEGQPGTIVESVAGRRVEVHVTSPRTGYAEVDGEPADGAVMLWFAWKELHPDTTVYRLAGD